MRRCGGVGDGAGGDDVGMRVPMCYDVVGVIIVVVVHIVIAVLYVRADDAGGIGVGSYVAVATIWRVIFVFVVNYCDAGVAGVGVCIGMCVVGCGCVGVVVVHVVVG